MRQPFPVSIKSAQSRWVREGSVGPGRSKSMIEFPKVVSPHAESSAEIIEGHGLYRPLGVRR